MRCDASESWAADWREDGEFDGEALKCYSIRGFRDLADQFAEGRTPRRVPDCKQIMSEILIQSI